MKIKYKSKEENLENIMKFIDQLLEEKNYKTVWHNGCYFHAHHKDNYFKCIEVSIVENDNIVICNNISVYSNGRSLDYYIEEITQLYNETKDVIKDIEKQLLNITSKENIMKMLKLCDVPKFIIDEIKR